MDVAEVLSDGWVANAMSETDSPKGIVNLMVADGEVNMTIRALIYCRLLWRPFIVFNKPITKNDIYCTGIDEVIDCGSKFIASTQTDQHELLLSLGHNKTEILEQLYRTRNDISNFQFEYCRHMVQSLSGETLNQIKNHPKLEEYVKFQHKQEEGTATAEKHIVRISKSLVNILSDRTAIDNNPLLPFMETFSLKANQIPQILVGYGTRNDVNGKMSNYIMNDSSLTGLRSLSAFAQEQLASKVAAWANKNSIADVQYSARELKLACSVVAKVYPGDCGSNARRVKQLTADDIGNYVHKRVLVDGVEHVITKENMYDFINIESTSFRSPTLCNHADGVCEACLAVRENNFTDWCPDNISIGYLSASVEAELVAQMVLSTKHLASTASGRFGLTNYANKIMYMKGLDIFYLPKHRHKLADTVLRIPVKALRPLNDLMLCDELPEAHTFSEVVDIGLDYKGSLDGFQLHSCVDAANIYLSKDMLLYIKDKNMTSVVDDMLCINLSKWRIGSPIFSYTLFNDDMAGHAARMKSFLMTQIRSCRTVNEALDMYCNLVFARVDINIIYLEIIIRAHMMNGVLDCNIPNNVDPEDATFGGMADVISGRAISMKLFHERVSKYLNNPNTYDTPRPSGQYDRYAGIIAEK